MQKKKLAQCLNLANMLSCLEGELSSFKAEHSGLSEEEYDYQLRELEEKTARVKKKLEEL